MAQQIDPRQRELLEQIMQWGFVAVDLTLFLDTHPDNREALRDYNRAVERLMALHKEYQERYGPLMAYGHHPSDYPWEWIQEPWPWEITF
ncbi:MAG: spore coat protein [Clostridia bacterium]|nr:spore coat protein [Clostridia bacterium]